MGVSSLETSYELTTFTELHLDIMLWASSDDTPCFYRSDVLRIFFIILHQDIALRNHWKCFSHSKFQQ